MRTTYLFFVETKENERFAGLKTLLPSD